MKSFTQIARSFFSKNKYPIALVILILVCLYPLSLFIYIPKWDNINGYLPYRYFISDYLWNGHLPLWNPFQRLGLPGYSDLQSGCWNPIVWVIMLFGKYTINSLIVELLSCYVIAGLGMFKLSNYFFNSNKTSFILALGYALSGFMVGSSQLMVFLIAVTWFPWCIYALLQFFNTKKLKYQLLTALFIALYITAASPAYTIILGYIIIGFFVYQIISNRKNFEVIKQILIGGVIILISLSILILPYINSFLEFAPYFNRVDKLEYSAFLLDNPFTPVSYLSFLFPFTVIANTDIFNITDLSLRDGYIGLIGLFCFISAFFSKFNSTKVILTIGLGVSLLLAAGDETFIFKLLYNLPGFGIFRHPSMFRAFSIFCMLLLAGFELKNIIETGIKKHHKISLLFILIVSLGASFFAFSKTSFAETFVLIKNVINFTEFSESSFSTHLFLNSALVITLILLFYIIKQFFKLQIFHILIIFTLLDLGIHSRFTTPTTICYNFKRAEVANYFNNLPNDINQEDNYTPLKLLDEKQGLKFTSGIWQNLSTFNKTLSSVGVNPMRFKDFDLAKESGALEINIENEIMFFPSKIRSNNDTLQKGLLWGVEDAINKMAEKTKLEKVHVGYNEFNAHITNSSNEQQWVLLNQNYHHLWNAYYNDHSLPIEKVNDMIMGVKIPGNSTGQLSFVFESSRTIYLFIISLLGYIFIAGYSIKNNYFIGNETE